MRRRRPTPFVVVLLGVLLLGGGLLAACRGGASSSNAGTTGRGTTASAGTPAFRAMAGALEGGRRARGGTGTLGLRGQGGYIAATGLELLKARMPHDLRRSDVERFTDARVVFGEALKGWVLALRDVDDEALWSAFSELDDSFRAWFDAYQGLSPEREV